MIEDYAVNDNQVKSKRDLSASPGERSEITHDLACEHSYALSVASEDSNDFWSTKKTVHKSTNISNDSSFSLVTRLCDNNVTHEALISEIREPNNNKVAKVPRAKTSLKRPCESDKEFRLNEFSLKRSLSKNVVEMVRQIRLLTSTTNNLIFKVTTEKLIKNATEQRQDDEIFKGWDRSEVEDGVIFTKILNQRQTFTRKHSQAPEYSPSIYQGIYNIAFAKSRRGFIYKCLIQSCQFQTLVKDSLMNHLKSKHENQQWNGFCNICAKKVLIGKTTVLQEFHHMNKLHVQLNKGVDSLLTENISKAESSSETREEVLINLINLRPWLETEKLKTKSEESELKMLSHEALCSLYKCMALTCIFFTTDQGLFLKHLALHERLTSSERENFLSCAYCDFVGASCKDLQEHVDKVHVYDRFQCNRCFYRSCANFNVLVHQFIYHSNEQNIIFECPELKQRDIRAELKEVKKNREKNIPPIVCVFCRGIFFAKTAFIDHLTKHADNLKARCIICNVETSTKTISDHLEKCHNIGLYQCVYCSMGTDTFDELSCHIANNHPSKLTVFCERTEHRYPDGSLKHVT